jgi:hypothetical protein
MLAGSSIEYAPRSNEGVGTGVGVAASAVDGELTGAGCAVPVEPASTASAFRVAAAAIAHTPPPTTRSPAVRAATTAPTLVRLDATSRV